MASIFRRKEQAMPQREAEEPLSEPRRMEIFQALVEAQDQEMSVPQSRKFISERYGISESQLRQIEQEGLDRQWPPL
jgi:hypothetical protein